MSVTRAHSDPPPSAGANVTDAPAPAEQAVAASAPRDAAYWAQGGSVLRMQHAPDGAVNLNVTGRRVTSPIQGFGKMWEKTYVIRLSGASVTPQEVIAEWKLHFPDFWPAGNRFYGPLTGIAPGEVALLNLSMAPLVRLSTGVMVLYADDESFTLMTPQGHVFAGWITFSASDDGGTTVVQTKVLMRAGDPFYEVGLAFGGHRRENRFWERTLRSLARHFGVEGSVVTRQDCIDSRRQWNKAGNVWHNAMIRSAFYNAAHAPVTLASKARTRREAGHGDTGATN
jgi:hypothetical protein